jgi:hypothetical protein
MAYPYHHSLSSVKKRGGTPTTTNAFTTGSTSLKS